MIQRRKPLARKTPLRRKTPLKRGGPIERGPRRIKIATAERRLERAQYSLDRDRYLEAHPFCQITIARYGIDEAELLRQAEGKNYVAIHRATSSGFIVVHRATQIHHRNKCRKGRLLDQRWWMSAAAAPHEWVESNKTEAREIGLLLPIQADADGRWGRDFQALITPALIASRAETEKWNNR